MSDRFSLTNQQYLAMLNAARSVEGGMGAVTSISCNAEEEDNVSIQRLGIKGAKLSGRVGIATLVGGDPHPMVVLAAPQARLLAAALLNAADELDGVTPLVFFPRDPFTEADPETGKGDQ